MTVSKGKIYFLLLLVLICMQVLPVAAQSDSAVISHDTTQVKPDSTSIYYFTGSLDSLKAGKLTYVDTTLTFLHQYDPIEAGNRMFNTLSNIGLASYNRVFSPSVSVGYVMKSHVFAPYMRYNDQVRYYKLMRPYTELRYVMGPAKEQSLGVTFSRKMSKQFTFGVDLYLVSAPGSYFNSKSNDNYVYFTSRYHTKNKRYSIIGNYLHNKVIARENGGVTADSLFTGNIEKDRKVIPVGLKTAQNMVKASGFYVEQHFNLQKPGMRKDSTHRRLSGGSISYAFLYQHNQMVYKDREAASDSGFYGAFPVVFDTLGTYDSIYQLKIRNRFLWSSLAYNEAKLSRVFRAWFGTNYDHIVQTLPYDSSKYINNQLIPFGGISLKLFQRSFLDASAEMVVGGYNNGDLKIKGSLLQYLGSVEKNIGQLYFSVVFDNRKPAWYFTEYSSNRFNWKLNLQKERIFRFTGEYRYKFIRTGATFRSLGNYTYFDDSVSPHQAANPGSVLQIYADGTIPLHYFGINLRAVYQTTSMAAFLHLPLLTGKMNIFFKKWIFKHAARLQTGIQLSYFTSYYADAYMPELRAFYTQHDKKIGDYLYLDLYASMKIKSFRFFVQGKNTLGLLGKNYHYYNSPGYPGADAGFYLGISWKLYN